MSMQIFECDQGSAEWHTIRAGIPTASEFATVLASGKDGGPSRTRRTYMRKLAGEILTGEPAENYSNGYMERGHAMEAEARDLYEFAHEADLTRAGFIRNGDTGCSPDSLVGSAGIVEIKTRCAHLMIETLEADRFPAEHVAQCQGALWVAEREWIDLVCYWPRLPLFVKRAYRDEAYIANLASAVDRFNEELANLVERIRRYGSEPSIKTALRNSLEMERAL